MLRLGTGDLTYFSNHKTKALRSKALDIQLYQNDSCWDKKIGGLLANYFILQF